MHFRQLTSSAKAIAKAISRSSLQQRTSSPDHKIASRCFQCFRPTSSCYCSVVPEIKNKTEIVVVQHAKERDHPFNTARMIRMALDKVQLHCGKNKTLARVDLRLGPKAGLLYPSKDSVCLDQLDESERPEQLVILDGTWPQAKTMLRDLPQLHPLPKYHLNPTQPGQYRIRLEPNDTSLSSVEATVAALRALEPETEKLDVLIDAFDHMVQQQLDHPASVNAYQGGPRSGRTVNIPRSLLGDASDIVVAYGEASYRDARVSDPDRKSPRRPLVWVAKRLAGVGDGACQTMFGSLIEPDVPLTSSFLKHLELSESDFANADSIGEFQDKWASFLKPNDILVTYNQGTIRILENVMWDIETLCNRTVTLKSINLGEQADGRSFVKYLDEVGVSAEPIVDGFGRAGKRLKNAIRLVRYLRDHSS